MIVISPACPDDRLSLRADAFADVIMAIGTGRYGEACLDLFGEALDAEHWALFHYRADHSVNCLATASRMHAAAALIHHFIFRDRTLVRMLPHSNE